MFVDVSNTCQLVPVRYCMIFCSMKIGDCVTSLKKNKVRPKSNGCELSKISICQNDVKTNKGRR